MSTRSLFFIVLFLPLFVHGQEPVRPAPLNAPTLAVLLANRPAHIAQAEWLAMMEQPVNRALYPLRVTQAMLDTLDARQLDMRYQYVLVKEEELRLPAMPTKGN